MIPRLWTCKELALIAAIVMLSPLSSRSSWRGQSRLPARRLVSNRNASSRLSLAWGMTQIALILLICNKTARTKLVSNIAGGVGW